MLLEELQRQLIDGFQLHEHLGLRLVDRDGEIGLVLPDDGHTRNHLGSQAAASLFAVGDAASGVALIAGLRPYMPAFAGVVSESHMHFLRPAIGPITAFGQPTVGPEEIFDAITSKGRTTVDVNATLTDRGDGVVCRIGVKWHVRTPGDGAPAIWRRSFFP